MSSFRMSWSRSAAIRSISASAVRVGAEAPFEARQNIGFALALDRDDEGKAEARAIGFVERGELRQLLRAEPVESGARLFARRFRRQRPGQREPPREVGMGEDQRPLLRVASLCRRGGKGLRQT